MKSITKKNSKARKTHNKSSSSQKTISKKIPKNQTPLVPPLPPKKTLPKIIINLNRQFQYTFDAWSVKNPPIKFQLYRTGTFLICLALTIFWPITNLLINFGIILLGWAILANLAKPVPRFFMLLNLMISISVIYYTMKVFLP